MDRVLISRTCAKIYLYTPVVFLLTVEKMARVFFSKINSLNMKQYLVFKRTRFLENSNSYRTRSYAENFSHNFRPVLLIFVGLRDMQVPFSFLILFDENASPEFD